MQCNVDPIASKRKCRFRDDLAFEKLRLRLFSDESLHTIETRPDGTKVNYGASIKKLCQAVDKGTF